MNDVQPFWPLLKLVEKKGDKSTKTLDRRINTMIGKGVFLIFVYDVILTIHVSEKDKFSRQLYF